jgi:DNA-directed RNA polymerase specialized sigma subunit
METLATSPRSPNYTTISCHGGGEDKLPSMLDKLFKAQKRVDDLAHKVSESVQMLLYVEELLDREKEREILFYRYFKGYSTQEIATAVHRSSSSIYRSRDIILEVIAPIDYVVI